MGTAVGRAAGGGR